METLKGAIGASAGSNMDLHDQGLSCQDQADLQSIFGGLQRALYCVEETLMFVQVQETRVYAPPCRHY
jgi:hypothetical protein